ncbi:MAG: ABC transporter permease, partial [Bdellovibrionota bacterium]
MKRKSALAILALFFLVAILSPIIAPDPNLKPSLEHRFEKPNASALLGRDHNGVDLLSEIMLGARTTIFIAITTVIIGVTTGLLIGSLSGFRGGFTDLAITRMIDMVQAFPGFLLALSL